MEEVEDMAEMEEMVMKVEVVEVEDMEVMVEWHIMIVVVEVEDMEEVLSGEIMEVGEVDILELVAKALEVAVVDMEMAVVITILLDLLVADIKEILEDLVFV